ncbi:hypothetical protein [Escherichia coli]|uniref:hypothetical protein n=1 Tax=Escherichia coli TaxID=562 RepID=UPI003BF674AF
MVAEVEQNCAAHTIFASNTSSLPIGGSPLTPRDLSKVIGRHLQSGGKKPAGGDYSSCGDIGANHRYHINWRKTG